MTNYVSNVLSAEDLEATMQALNTLREKMPYLVKLSAEQKKASSMLEDGRLPFVQKALSYAQREASLNFNATLLDEANKDLSLYNSLAAIEREMSRLAEMVKDTRMAAGAEAYEAARVIYKMAKVSASMNVPGTQSILDDLGKLFNYQGKATGEPENPANN
jgi:hypothetical protein